MYNLHWLKFSKALSRKLTPCTLCLSCLRQTHVAISGMAGAATVGEIHEILSILDGAPDCVLDCLEWSTVAAMNDTVNVAC